MAKVISMDLRNRLVVAVRSGWSQRQRRCGSG